MSAIRFIESDHKYYLGDKELISVTTLLRKHGITQSYDHIDPEVLETKARYGTAVHKEIESYIKGGDYFIPEVDLFHQWVQENGAHVIGSEFIVHDDLIAGTVDLELLLPSEPLPLNVIADIKTSSRLDKVSCSWQLSLYNLLHKKQADMLLVFHFNKGKLKVEQVDFIPSKDIDFLLICEYKGVAYSEVETLPF